MKVYKEAARKTYGRSQEVTELVAEIIENVKTRGDREILELTKKFDGIDMDTVKVGRAEIEKAYTLVSEETVEAIKNAAAQIRFFAEKQLECMTALTTASPVPGVTLGHRLIPVETDIAGVDETSLSNKTPISLNNEENDSVSFFSRFPKKIFYYHQIRMQIMIKFIFIPIFDEGIYVMFQHCFKIIHFLQSVII